MKAALTMDQILDNEDRREATQLSVKEIYELQARADSLQKCHDSELGVCFLHCDEVKQLQKDVQHEADMASMHHRHFEHLQEMGKKNRQRIQELEIEKKQLKRDYEAKVKTMTMSDDSDFHMKRADKAEAEVERARVAETKAAEYQNKYYAEKQKCQNTHERALRYLKEHGLLDTKFRRAEADKAKLVEFVKRVHENKFEEDKLYLIAGKAGTLLKAVTP